jgi:sRNA-binding carbon storage regulator CsrA
MVLCISVKALERVALDLPDGRRVWVRVHEVHGHTVRLAFDAPADVRILREKLLEQVATKGGDVQ